jgi:hypothetical protein
VNESQHGKVSEKLTVSASTGEFFNRSSALAAETTEGGNRAATQTLVSS